jgi:exodeoxyribonuclease VII large subunit
VDLFEAYPQRYRGGGCAAALRVSDLTLHLTALVREDVILQDVWVTGEVSNLTHASSGHIYFSLKDEEATLSCVLWRSSAYALRFRPEPGMQVLAHGQVDVYAARGQYQLVVDRLLSDGAGDQHLGLEQVKQRLIADGTLDSGRKRPFPAFPRRVAVVTSLTGAVVRDICVTLRAAPHPPDVVLVPVVVQGEGAEESLCEGLRLANEASGADLIVVARGGGSAEDLWAFNSEAVARAIAGSRLPVVSAVGHETDVTLADLAADMRAPTPTAAAEAIVGQRGELIRRAERAAAEARSLFSARLEAARLRYDGLQRRIALAQPQGVVERRRQRLDDLDARLERAARACLAGWQHRVAAAAGRLSGVSPLATLARGYAVVTRLPQEMPVTRAEDVTAGDEVRVRLADGAFRGRVEAVEAEGCSGERGNR